MNFAKVQETVATLSADERLEVLALIIHLNRSDDSEYRSDLDRRMSAMDGGEKVSEQKLKNLARN
jgi:hypothetical protein